MANRKVLVVEDDRDLRDTTADILALSGHEYVVAEDGIEALRRVDEGFTPDVVLIDLLMPRMDGATLIEKLRERAVGPRPRTVVVTGVRSRHVQRLLGADAVLFKPYEAEELLRVIAADPAR